MSETPFLKPEQLGLSEEEFCGLVKTMEGLQDGTLLHDPEQNKGAGFNMSVWREKHDCGTTCCIGGWTEMLAGLPPDSLYRKASRADGNGNLPTNSSLYQLFFQATDDYVTPRQAARAIGNFLRTGRPNWDDAIHG